MTNATQTLAIIFAGTLVLALATSWSWSGSSSAAFQQKLFAVDTSAVETVRIDRSDGPSIRLNRSDGTWMVSPSDTAATFPADPDAIDDVLRTLPTLEVSAVATRQTDKHARYGVDSTGTLISMLGAEDERLAELRIGRTRIRRSQNPGGRQSRLRRMRQGRGTPITYVRQPSRPDVYSIETSLRSLTNRTVTDWREKQLWSVGRSNIRSVDVTMPGDTSFTMTRAVSPDSTQGSAAGDTWLSEGDTLSTSEVSSMLRLLSSPEADGFVANASPETFGATPYTVRLELADGSERSLHLRPDSSSNQYIATADGFPYVVHLDRNSWDQSVLLHRSALLKEDD